MPPKPARRRIIRIKFLPPPGARELPRGRRVFEIRVEPGERKVIALGRKPGEGGVVVPPIGKDIQRASWTHCELIVDNKPSIHGTPIMTVVDKNSRYGTAVGALDKKGLRHIVLEKGSGYRIQPGDTILFGPHAGRRIPTTRGRTRVVNDEYTYRGPKEERIRDGWFLSVVSLRDGAPEDKRFFLQQAAVEVADAE